MLIRFVFLWFGAYLALHLPTMGGGGGGYALHLGSYNPPFKFSRVWESQVGFKPGPLLFAGAWCIRLLVSRTFDLAGAPPHSRPKH